MNPDGLILDILREVDLLIQRLKEISDKTEHNLSGTVRHEGFNVIWSEDAKKKGKK